MIILALSNLSRGKDHEITFNKGGNHLYLISLRGPTTNANSGDNSREFHVL